MRYLYTFLVLGLLLLHPVSSSAFSIDYEIYCPAIFADLKKGDTDATTNGQVSRLQHFLNTRLTLNTPIGKGLPQLSGGVFGQKTETYVKKFQKNSGLQGLGMVGPKTRSVIAIIGCGATASRPENLVPRENMGTGAILFGEGIVVDPLTEALPKNVREYAFYNGVQKSDVIKLSYVNEAAFARRFNSLQQRGGSPTRTRIVDYPGIKVYVTCGWQTTFKRPGEPVAVPDAFGGKCNPYSIGATDGSVDLSIDQGAFN